MNTAEQGYAGLDQRPKGVDLTDIVYQSEQPPLYIHFQFGTQSEAVHALVHTDVGKDRLDNAQSSGVDLLSLFGIDLSLHRIDQVGLLRIHWDGKIPARGRWFGQTACLQRTDGTVFHAGMVHIIGSIEVGLVAGMAGQFFPLRTQIHLFGWLEREVRCGKKTCLHGWPLPAVDTILEALLIGKVRIAFTELDVGDISIDLFITA